MNKPALRKLLRHLIKQQKSVNAARFNMNYFGVGVRDGSNMEGMLERPICKTQACLAGEAVLSSHHGFLERRGGIKIYKKYNHYNGYTDIIGNHYNGYTDIIGNARELLGLTKEEQNRLFFFQSMLCYSFEKGWPTEFQKQYEAAKTPAARLEVAIRRLRHFIDTDGTDRPLPQSESERSQAELEPLPG
jgi:hypothetical protein